MNKRRRDGSLTGGTGDVNPQWMSFSVKQTGADTDTGGAIQPPVSLSTGENLAMEILRVYVATHTPIPAGATWLTNFWLSTKNFGTTFPALGIGDATVIVDWLQDYSFTTSGASYLQREREYPFDDGAGHGVLVGNQNLYWGIHSVATGNTVQMDVKILYRAKRISDSELLGIVLQSNQN